MKKPMSRTRQKETTEDSVAYRTKKLVTQYYVLRGCHNKRYEDPICPTCNNILDRCYQKYCCSCGQHLKWGIRKNIEYIYSKGFDCFGFDDKAK